MQRFLLERFARGALPPFLASWVEARIASDERWARAYHELRVVERALSGPSNADDANDALSAAQLAKITGAVLGARAPVPSRAPRFVLAGAVGALACVAIFIVINRGGEGGDGFHARGDGHTGVHARCVDATRAKILAEADLAGGELKCPKGGLIAFSATNTTDKTLYVSGLATSDVADSATLFTLPFDGEPPFAVAPKSVDLPMKRGFAIDDSVSLGFRVGAVLVDTPPQGAQPAPGAEHTLHVVVTGQEAPR